MNKTVNILGTEYTIRFATENGYPNLKCNDGYTDTSSKEIIIDDMTIYEDDVSTKRNIKAYKNQVLRHEVVHAFLAESGIDGNGHSTDHWEFNEEMVDWFAIQSPKIFKVFQKLDIL